MGVIRRYHDLIAWKIGIKLVKTVYQVSAQWPADERFGLISQVRRAAVSIPSNIAEGFGRKSGKDFVRFLKIASGSLMEVETQLHISAELGFCSRQQLEPCFALSSELIRVIKGLARSVGEQQ